MLFSVNPHIELLAITVQGLHPSWIKVPSVRTGRDIRHHLVPGYCFLEGELEV